MEFQKLHWEAMESAFEKMRDPSWPPILIRRVITPNIDSHVDNTNHDHPILERPPNLLLVVARQPKSDDIDPFLSAGFLTGLCKSLCARLDNQGIRPNLEIARPGTWNAFERLLDLRTHQWHEKGGSGPWFDIVHFDVHGSVKDSEAYVHFLSGSGERVFKQSSTNVGKALARNHVATVFLNACESGRLSEAPSACFAKGLMDFGVSNVLAMSYSLTNTAASTLISTFYTHLLVFKFDFWAASRVARQALRVSKLRDCKFGRKVELEDSIIPIVFTSKPAPNESLTNNHVIQQPSGMSDVPSLAENATIVASKILADLKIPPMVGRESDVLKMEFMAADDEPSQLGTSSKGRIILLKGSVGVGKSEFARYLASWWKETNFVKSAVYLDMKSPTFEEEMKGALTQAERMLMDASVSSAGSTLYIFDHVESKTLPTSRTPFDMEGKRSFKTAIASLASAENIVVVISRKNEEWLRVPIPQRHELQNLDPYSATVFASKIYDDLGLKHVLESHDEAGALDILLCRLDYNPLSIEAFLYALVKRGAGLDDFTPSSFLNQMLRLPDYIPLLSDSHVQIQESRDFVNQVIKQQGQLANHVLSRLALSSGWFDEDWYRLVYLSGGLDFNLNDTNINAFVKKYLLTSGWVRKASDVVQIYKNGQVQPGETLVVHGYYMNAVLINAVREGFGLALTPRGHNPQFTRGMWWHFVELMVRKAGTYSQSNEGTLEDLRHRILTEVEAFSLLTAFEVCFQDALEPFLYGTNKRMWGSQGLWTMLQHLHRCSKKITREVQTAPQTVALSLSMIVPRMERVQNYLFLRLAAGHVDFKVETGLTNLEYCMLVTRMLAEHYYIRSPMKTGQYIALCLGLICRYPDRIVRFNWQVQDIFAWLLVTLSYCYLYTYSFSQPIEILRVALQVCRRMEQHTVIEDLATMPPTRITFDLAVLSREDVENSPYRATLASRMYVIATLRICAFKALRMAYQVDDEERQANKMEELENKAYAFFFQFFPAAMLNDLPRLGVTDGDFHVLYVSIRAFTL
jgi:hypothetical protein